MGKRLIAVFGAFTLCALLLFVRVGSLATDGALAETAAAQSRYTLEFGETRGMIYDCRMLPLVDVERRHLAACLPMPENMNALDSSSYLLGDVGGLMETGRPFLTGCAADELDIPGVEVFPVAIRTGREQLARHVVGYLDSEGRGLTGVEKAFDGYLRAGGAASSISYLVDATRAPLRGAEPEIRLAPEPTGGVVLTIDRRIQKIVERAGAQYLKKGAIVVMEPSTGKIRACASFPQYDTWDLGAAVQDTEASPLLNRAFCAYSAGSIFKIVTMAAALSQGISPDFPYTCTGEETVEGAEGTPAQLFHCHKEEGHGTLNMRGAMMGSCNPYFIELGLLLDKSAFLNMARDLSFGRAGELADGLFTAAGTLPELAAIHSPAAVANLSFGQGELTATPIQIAQMVSAVLNGGSTPRASLIEGLTTGGRYVEQAKAVPLPIKAMSAEAAGLIRQYMIAGVEEEPGQNAKPRYVTAGGKTGTAQTGQVSPTRMEEEEPAELLQGWFAGFFPAEEPKYVAVVLAEDAQSGNQDASPVFRAIADGLYQPLGLPGENPELN